MIGKCNTMSKYSKKSNSKTKKKGLFHFLHKVIDEEDYLEYKFKDDLADRKEKMAAIDEQKENPPHKFVIIDEEENDEENPIDSSLGDQPEIMADNDFLYDGMGILGSYSSEDTVVLIQDNIRRGKEIFADDEVLPRAMLISTIDGSSYLIDGNEWKIGRDYRKCDLVSKVKTVGRMHGMILRKQGQFYVQDYNSMNGTYLNGNKERISPGEEILLHDGDRIRFAEDEYIFKIGDR